MLGIHRFMTGKVLSGIGMLVTGGGLGVWWLLDLRSVAICEFRDKEGLLVAMPPQEDISNKSFGTIFLLWIFAVHRFFSGKKGPAILYLLTLGGFGIWAVIDFFNLSTGKFKDRGARPILAVAK